MPKHALTPETPPFGEYPRFTYDEVEDGLLCHECGGWHGNLATHT